MARPTRCTDEVTTKIAGLIRLGVSLATAARACRLHPDVVYRWRSMPGARYRRFGQEIDAAEAEGEVRLIGLIQHAATNGDARWAAWLLARRFGARWGDSAKVELVQVPPAPTVADRWDLGQLDDDELAEFETLLAKVRGAVN